MPDGISHGRKIRTSHGDSEQFYPWKIAQFQKSLFLNAILSGFRSNFGGLLEVLILIFVQIYLTLGVVKSTLWMLQRTILSRLFTCLCLLRSWAQVAAPASAVRP